MSIIITEDWSIDGGVDSETGLNVKYIVDAPVIQAPRGSVNKQRIFVPIIKELYNNGVLVKSINDGYTLTRGQEHRYFDGTQMQEKDDLGNLVFEEDGITPVMGRTQSYERVIYALENGLFTKQTFLDGIKEYYKIS